MAKNNKYDRESAFNNFTRLFNQLPDPDVILRKKGIDITAYRDLLVDEHLGSCITSRRAGLLSKEWYIDVDSTRRQDKRARDFIRDIFKNQFDVDYLLRVSQEANLFGMSVFEHPWQSDGTYQIFESIEDRPVEWFFFDQEDKLRFKSRKAPVKGEEVDMRNVHMVRHNFNYYNLYGERLLSRCFWPVSFKRGGLQFWLTFLEKYGGILMWLMTEEQDDIKLQKHKDMLDDMVATATGVFTAGPNDKIVTVDGNKSGSAEAFLGLVEYCDRGISKAILGQTLTTEQGNVGSQALGTVHMDVREDFVNMDVRMVVNFLNSLIKTLVDRNIQVDVHPTFRIFEENAVNKELAERDEKLKSNGVRFKKSYYIKNYHLEDEDFEVMDSGTDTGIPPAFAAAPSDGEQKIRQNGQDFERFLNSSSGIMDRIMKPIRDSIDTSTVLAASYDDLIRSLSFQTVMQLSVGELADAFRSADIQGRIEARATLGSSEFASWADQYRMIQEYDESQFIEMKIPVDRKLFDSLGSKYRDYAFTVTGDLRLSEIEGLQQSLVDAKKQGIPFKQWREQQSGQFGKKLTPQHLKLVYDENMNRARMAGKYSQMMDDTDIAPYWQYIAVMDSHTRPTHAALNRTIRRFDDPFWRTHFPQWEFGCRCDVRSLSAAYLRAKGLNPSDYDAPMGNPDLAEIMTNNADNEAFELFTQPSLNSFDKNGKLITADGIGSSAKNMYNWLRVKQGTFGSEWKSLSGKKNNLKRVFSDTAGVDFTPFDGGDKAAAEFLQNTIIQGKEIDPFGNPVYLGDAGRFIKHIVEAEGQNRVKYINLIKKIIKNPDAVFIDAQEMVGSTKGVSRKKAGLIKLSRNYVLKIKEDGKDRFLVLASNYTGKSKEFTVWTLFETTKLNGDLVWKK